MILSSKTTHAKLMVVDGQLTLLGSTNWTYYALTSNNEASVLIRSQELARAIIDYFNRVKATGSKNIQIQAKCQIIQFQIQIFELRI